MLHGVFGSGDNWWSIARKLEDEFRIYLPDQRNHGKSFHSQELCYDLLVADLADWMHHQDLSRIHLVGHSMGGKAAMAFAVRYPEKLRSLTVVDIAPKAYRMDHHAGMLQAMKDLDLAAFATRSALDAALKPSIPDEATRLFVLKNVERGPQGEFRWRIALNPLADSLSAVGESLPAHAPVVIPTLLVRGAKSQYVTDEDWVSFKSSFTHSTLETLAGAGHWVHADQPEALTLVLRNFLNSHREA